MRALHREADRSVRGEREGRSSLLFAAGFTLGVCVEPMTHWLLLGAPLARFQGLSGSHAKMLSSVADDVAYSGFNLAWIGDALKGSP